MFRRREDEGTGQSDTQGSLLNEAGMGESVTVLPPQANTSYNNSSASAAPQSTSAPIASSFQMSAAAAKPSEPAASSRPSSSAINPFRASPSPAEVSRSRMPESKPAAFPSAQSAISGSEKGRESRRVLTVGADILLKGEIATCDRLVIEGKVDAVLNDVGTVELAESGSFKGTAHVENAEISGLFEGELVVKSRLVIYASGRVRGKITYGEIEVERGGEITGEIKTISSSTSASSARSTRTSAPAKKEEAAAA